MKQSAKPLAPYVSMSEERLAYIKAKTKDFYLLINLICNKFCKSQKHLETVSVLLQNLQFSGVDCEGYSHEESVAEVFEIQKIFNEIAKYYDSHFENWIAHEINDIIDFDSIHYMY